MRSDRFLLTGCPSDEQLRAFALGQLDLAAIEQVGDHLDHCAACSLSLQQLEEPADTVVSRLRAPPPRDGFTSEPAFRDLRRRCRWIRVAPLPELAGAEHAVEPAELAPGTLVGSYRLLEVLGRGGMGCVYRARHLRLHRDVALKILPADRLHDPQAVERFYREMEAVGRLNHRHLVRATDAGEAGGVHFIAMELVDGVDAATVVRALGPLPVADACEIVRQAALGLQYAHQRGLVHRDIKPSNLLLSRDGQVLIADLGLARFQSELPTAGELTASRQVMGTADYMAPEQCSDARQVDIRTDLYSLGCTLHKLLFGRPPFGGARYDTPVQKLVAHLSEPLPPLPPIDHPHGAALETLLKRLLAKSPADRPAEPGEVSQAIEPFCQGARLADVVQSTLVFCEEPVTQVDDSPVPAVGKRHTRAGAARVSRWWPWGMPAAWSRRTTALASLAVVLAAAVGLSILWRLPAGGVPADLPGGSTAPEAQRGSSPADTSLASVSNLSLPRVEPLDVWQTLLDRPPDLLYWLKGPGTTLPRYDPVKQEVLAMALDHGLLKLGEVHRGSFQVQVGMRQPQWEGHIGVFFGCKIEPQGELSRMRWHSIHLHRVGLERELTIQREQFTMDFDPRTGQSKLCGGHTLAAQAVPPPPPREHILEFVVDQGRLSRVRWGGAVLEKLTDPSWWNHEELDDAYGHFGIHLLAGSGAFTNARLMVFDE